MLELQKILVVCVGNICRSPMAEVFFQQLYPHKQIASAGLNALVGYPADEMAQQVMQEIGLDLTQHKAQQLSTKLVKDFDLILCMSREQEKWIKRQWGFATGKVYRIGHWLDTNVDDPFQKPKPAFILARECIQQSVLTWQQRII